MYESRRGLQKMLVTVLALVAVTLASGQGMGEMGNSQPGHMRIPMISAADSD
jgi:hypothetical protein